MNKIRGSPTNCLFSATLVFFIGLAAVSLFGPTAHQFGSAPVLLATGMRAFQERYGRFPAEKSK